MARRKKGDKINGWLNAYKPRGMGSTDAVSVFRRTLNAQKAGHAGTLDPLAEGLLPIALGEATKTIPFIQDGIKTYSFDVVWGEQRSTDDAEGDVVETSDIRPSQEEIIAALPAFIGDIDQTPPIYSAIKIDGQRAYDLARAGELPEMKSRQVYIESFDMTAATDTHASFEVVCGKGTYIRSLGRDLAIKLGTVGYIDNLKRLQVGYFDTSNAFFLDSARENVHKEAVLEALLPVDTGLDDIPILMVTADEAQRLRNGQAVSLISRADVKRIDALELPEDNIARLYLDDTCIGLAEIQKYTVQPKRLFNLNEG